MGKANPTSIMVAALVLWMGVTPVVIAQTGGPAAVSALGRLEPEHGVMRIGIPSTSSSISGSVVAELMVEEGDWVKAGQLLASTDSTAMLNARLAVARAEHEESILAAAAAVSQAEEVCTLSRVAASEAERRTNLLARNLASAEETERAKGDAEANAASCTAARAASSVAESAVHSAQARVGLHEAELERSLVRAPVAARVLEIYARPGEFVHLEGLLELGRTNSMFAIAEVHETDVARVRLGQSARISSDALPAQLSGKVEHIRHKIYKQDVIDTDPAASKDARIVEVEIRLDDSSAAENLTNLQVDIVIGG